MSDKHATLENRDGFQSKWGFILACIGSAVGMGNIWRFPIMVSVWGGMTFLIPYFICVLLIGSTGVIGEFALGRATGAGPIGAFGECTALRGNRKIGEGIGLIPVIGSMALAIGYTVVMGWIFKYTFISITGDMHAMGQDMASIGGHFDVVAVNNVPCIIVAILASFAIMALGVSGGIEKANKIMMPALFVLFVVLGVYIAFLPGSGAGYKYIFTLDPKGLLNPLVWIFAFGQAFFSLSVAGNGSVIYGSSWDNLDFGMLYWKDGKVDWAGSDVRRIHTEINRYGEEEICVDAMRCMADLTQISPNGKWIAGAYRYEIMEDGNYHIETYPAVFNTETGKTVIIKDYGERVVSHITNDGIVCIANSSYLPNDGFMYDVNTQTNLGSVQEWILSTYGIIAPMGYIRHVSPDGQYLMAHTMEDSALQPRVVGWYLAPALEK